ncbi:MAG TPA: hypothetical protein VFP92_10625 [Rhodanobacteraceae bacterium]|nr:hypothetical protein [Rhodanobacteraceae bacterium]
MTELLAARRNIMWENWVLDVTHGHEPMAFCPIEDNGTIIIGLTMISGKCPGRFVGIVHFDGDDAANAWLAEHSAIVDELAAANAELSGGCKPSA